MLRTEAVWVKVKLPRTAQSALPLRERLPCARWTGKI